MNVSVFVPRPLQPACEGRSRIELGVPPGTETADVLLTLVALYPGLRAWVADERHPFRRHFQALRAGPRLLLVASPPPPRSA